MDTLTSRRVERAQRARRIYDRGTTLLPKIEITLAVVVLAFLVGSWAHEQNAGWRSTTDANVCKLSGKC